VSRAVIVYRFLTRGGGGGWQAGASGTRTNIPPSRDHSHEARSRAASGLFHALNAATEHSVTRLYFLLALCTEMYMHVKANGVLGAELQEQRDS
jgi:hypothetical protein